MLSTNKYIDTLLLHTLTGIGSTSLINHNLNQPQHKLVIPSPQASLERSCTGAVPYCLKVDCQGALIAWYLVMDSGYSVQFFTFANSYGAVL